MANWLFILWSNSYENVLPTLYNWTKNEYGEIRPCEHLGSRAETDSKVASALLLYCSGRREREGASRVVIGWRSKRAVTADLHCLANNRRREGKRLTPPLSLSNKSFFNHNTLYSPHRYKKLIKTVYCHNKKIFLS